MGRDKYKYCHTYHRIIQDHPLLYTGKKGHEIGWKVSGRKDGAEARENKGGPRGQGEERFPSLTTIL